MKTITAYLQKSDKKDKKFKVTIVKPNEKNKIVYFGASGYSDFTKHKDKERMKRYDNRHKSRENWTKSGITTAGFWSKWILWSKPSLEEAKKYTANKFNITIKGGKPPTNDKSIRKSPKRKSRKVSKSRRKSRKVSKSRRKSTRKSTRKSARKSTRKSTRKSARKSARKSTRKSARKVSKSTRKSRKVSKSRRKSRKASKSRRKSRKSTRKSRKVSKSRRNKPKFNSIKTSAFSNSGWYIVTKDGCPYCDKAKALLTEKGINYKVEVLNNSNKEQIYKKLDSLTNNYRYFPMIFYNDKFIGGYTELKKYNF
jgi:glutaredoxin